MKRYFITGNGTGIGKTFVSAIFTEALGADYWKPVQCGDQPATDRQLVSSLVSNTNSVFHPETYCFKEPVSPHLASAMEDTKIRMEAFILPETEHPLIIEGAGGLLVPLNAGSYVVDLARDFGAEIILVCGSYLGCINHSLLSIDYLIKNDFELKGLVLNGNFESDVKKAIINYAEVPVIAEIPRIATVSKESVLNLAQNINLSLL